MSIVTEYFFKPPYNGLFTILKSRHSDGINSLGDNIEPLITINSHKSVPVQFP